MKYLLDTNHWSYLQEGWRSVVERVSSLSDDSVLVMSVVTQAELMAGVLLVPDAARRERLLNLYRTSIQSAAEVLPVTPRIAEEFAAVFVELRRKGRPIPTNDIWLAATARAFTFTLVTADRHFDYVDGLLLENWME